jgi:hypothetical protein
LSNVRKVIHGDGIEAELCDIGASNGTSFALNHIDDTGWWFDL